MALTTGTVLDSSQAARYRADQTPGARVLGRSGMPLFGGRAQGYETNARYTDGKWWSERAPRVALCPPVDTATATLVDMMLSATFSVAGEGAPALWLRRQFGIGAAPRMADTWEALLRRLVRPVFVGAGAYEWTTRVDATDTTAQAAGTVYLERLYDRSHRAITAYLTDELEQLAGVRMWGLGVTSGLGVVDIPLSQLLYLCFRPRGDTDFDGWGLWRPIAEEASDHSEIGNQLRIGARRYAVGDVDLALDLDIAQRVGIQTTEAWCTAEAARMEAWASARETGGGYVTRMPWWRLGTFGGAGSGGTGQGYNPAALVAQRDHYKAAIYEQLAAEYLQIGSQGGGSYSAAEVKVSRAAAVARNLLDWVLSELHRQVVEPLLRINFPDLAPDEYPRIAVSGLRAPVFVEHAALLVQFAQAGIVTKTDELERAVCEAFELPSWTGERSAEDRAFTSPVAAPSVGANAQESPT